VTDLPGTDVPTPADRGRSAATDRSAGPAPATDVAGRPTGDAYLVPPKGSRSGDAPTGEVRFEAVDRFGSSIGAVEVTQVGEPNDRGAVPFQATVEVASDAFQDISDTQLLAKFGVTRADIGDSVLRVPVESSVSPTRIAAAGGDASVAAAQFTDAAVRGLLVKALEGTAAEAGTVDAFLARPLAGSPEATEPDPATAPTEVTPVTRRPPAEARAAAAGAARDLASAGVDVGRDLVDRGREFAGPAAERAKGWWGEASTAKRAGAVLGGVVGVGLLWGAFAGRGGDDYPGIPTPEAGNEADNPAPPVTLPQRPADTAPAVTSPVAPGSATDGAQPNTGGNDTTEAPTTTVVEIAWPVEGSTDFDCLPRDAEQAGAGIGTQLVEVEPLMYLERIDTEYAFVYCAAPAGSPVTAETTPSGVLVDRHERSIALSNSDEYATELLGLDKQPVAAVAFNKGTGVVEIFAGSEGLSEYRRLQARGELGQPA